MNAEPDAGDVEALVAIHAKWGARNPRSSRDLAKAILASPVLDAMCQKAAAERAEQIAQAMPEAFADRVTWGDGTEYIAVTEAQRIARESR